MSEPGGLVKAVIREVEGSGSVTCAFNPTAYSITKSAAWEQPTQLAAKNAPEAEFTGTRPRELSMTLLFDSWGSGRSIAGDVDQLLAWTNPTESSLNSGTPEPPSLTFTWGSNKFFTAYLASAQAGYELFDSDGTPLRAKVTVSFIEIPEKQERQNPTSGGPTGKRSALVTEDAGLAAIAYREYGRASLWRGLAAANGIDDPFRVPIGTSLLVPQRADVEALS
jgi:Contractile injection system tube protein